MDTLYIEHLLKQLYGDHFSFHPEFLKEFMEETKNSGSQERLLKQFLARLGMIIALGDCDCGLNWLEKLKKYDNMYSMHLKADSKNFRLLFSKDQNGKYFLRMFYEKSGKKATSYAPNVEIAMKRRDRMEG